MDDEILKLQKMLQGSTFAWMTVWKIRYIRKLVNAILNIAVTWDFEEEVEIGGFVNIYRRCWIRRRRRAHRIYMDLLWCDKPSHKLWEKHSPDIFIDIFRLRRLFGMEPLVPDNKIKTEHLFDNESFIEMWCEDISPIDEMSSARTSDDEFQSRRLAGFDAEGLRLSSDPATFV